VGPNPTNKIQAEKEWSVSSGKKVSKGESEKKMVIGAKDPD